MNQKKEWRKEIQQLDRNAKQIGQLYIKTVREAEKKLAALNQLVIQQGKLAKRELAKLARRRAILVGRLS